MKYKTEKQKGGMSTRIIGQAIDGLEMTEWMSEYDFRTNSLNIRRYTFYERETKRHKWQSTARCGWKDRRQDTLTVMPLPPPELRDLMLKEFIKNLSVTCWKDK